MKGCTPMGTVPISVIYGFEYPYGKPDCNAITSLRMKKPAREGWAGLPRKTRGCLSDIKVHSP